MPDWIRIQFGSVSETLLYPHANFSSFRKFRMILGAKLYSIGKKISPTSRKCFTFVMSLWIGFSLVPFTIDMPYHRYVSCTFKCSMRSKNILTSKKAYENLCYWDKKKAPANALLGWSLFSLVGSHALSRNQLLWMNLCAATKRSTGGTFMTRKQAEMSKIKLHRAAGNV